MSKNQKDVIKLAIQMCLKVVKSYEWLLDLYVLDFFIDNHWTKLPFLWQDTFVQMDPQDIGKILMGENIKHVLPLSFLSLLKAISSLSLSRERSHEYNRNTENLSINHPKLKNLFLKHVKLKKRHEIEIMSEIVNKITEKCDCNRIVDFGSGLGHLVRILSYKYNKATIGIEMQTKLSQEARKLDLELEYTVKKYLTRESFSKMCRPTHLNTVLSSLDQLHDLSITNTMDLYGLVGLHPCGDLGPLLIKHFVAEKQVKFICVVGCCYMKLSEAGYPMSNYAKNRDSSLSYVSREIACHSIDTYIQKLCIGDYNDLKVHAYRAALEKLLVQLDPKLKHLPIRSVKHTHDMSFENYCTAALEKLSHEYNSLYVKNVEEDLERWKRVVVLYTLRLMLAPLVETVILLDRMLYILENDISCEIYPMFDPKISPRNHVIVGRKNKS